MSGINKNDSEIITFLRLPLAYFVVLLHCAGTETISGSMISCKNGFYDTSRILISNGLCKLAVPLFFIISGYLFFSGFCFFDRNIYVAKIQKRIKSVLFPYIAWNLICFIVYYLYELLYDFKYGFVSPGIFEFFKDKGGLKMFINSNNGYPINYPLWFLRDLFFLCIISPYVFIVKKHKLEIILILAYLIIPCFGINQNYFTGILFFYIGSYLRMENRSLCISNKKTFLLFASIVLLLVSVITYNRSFIYSISIGLFTLFGCPLIFWAANILNKKYPKCYKGSSSCTFFVYATHTILILTYVSNYLHNILDVNEFGYFFAYLSTSIITFVIVVILYRILRLIMPKALSLLTGYR